MRMPARHNRETLPLEARASPAGSSGVIATPVIRDASIVASAKAFFVSLSSVRGPHVPRSGRCCPIGNCCNGRGLNGDFALGQTVRVLHESIDSFAATPWTRFVTFVTFRDGCRRLFTSGSGMGLGGL
jgi:hypothetical protein